MCAKYVANTKVLSLLSRLQMSGQTALQVWILCQTEPEREHKRLNQSEARTLFSTGTLSLVLKWTVKNLLVTVNWLTDKIWSPFLYFLYDRVVSVGMLPSFWTLSRLTNASSHCWTPHHKSSRLSKKKKPKYQIIPRLTWEAKYTRSPSTLSNP